MILVAIDSTKLIKKGEVTMNNMQMVCDLTKEMNNYYEGMTKVINSDEMKQKMEDVFCFTSNLIDIIAKFTLKNGGEYQVS